MAEDDKTYSQEDYDKVVARREELQLDYGDGDDELNSISDVEINEQLRDEFRDDKYEDILIELGINDDESELGLVEDTIDDDGIGGEGGDNEKGQSIVNTLLDGSKHVKRVEKRLKGWEWIDDKWVKTSFFLIPREEINSVVLLLESLYLPQNISSKLHLNVIEFESNMNTQLQHIKRRITNCSDDICKVGMNKFTNTLLLGEIQVIINAIQSGRLGDLTSDMVVGSYNERKDIKPEEVRQNALKELLNIK